MTWTVIVPSNRERELKKFLSNWNKQFNEYVDTVVIMWDGNKPPNLEQGDGITRQEPQTRDYELKVLCWKDIKAKHIPKKTDMVRSWAFKWAYENTGADYFLTLDDDVEPSYFYDLFHEYEKVFREGAPLSEYIDVGAFTDSEVQMRGYPYRDRVKREVAVQYGSWDGVLDYDAAEQIARPKGDRRFTSKLVFPVPKGAAATCCIMNCAWQREYTPIMWQLPMLEGRYNRVGDIWSGLLIKKTLDSINNVMVINTKANVYHDRASNVYNSLQKEAPSVVMNDNLWGALNFIVTNTDDMMGYYKAYTDGAIDFFKEHDKEYAKHFKVARDEWLSLWK